MKDFLSQSRRLPLALAFATFPIFSCDERSGQFPDIVASASIRAVAQDERHKWLSRIRGDGLHTIKAKGVKNGYDDSAIARADFTIN